MATADGARPRLIEAATVAVVAVLLSIALVAEPRGPLEFRSDQSIVNLMVVKHLHPELLRRDALYGRDYERFYVGSFVRVQALLSTDDDPITGLRRIGYGIGVLFFLSHYVLFRFLGTSAVAAGVGSLGAMTIRNALGGEYWGYGGLSWVDPRSVANAVTPLLLLAFLRWRQPWRVCGYFALTGVLASVHPVSALHLYQTGVLVHLILERGRLRAWLEAAVGAALFVLGASPFLAGFLRGGDNITDPALFPVIRQIQEFRWPYLFLPLSLDALVSVAFHMLLPAALLFWLWRSGAWTGNARRLALFGAVALSAAIAGTALVQVWAVVTDRPYATYQQLRMGKLVYPALLAAFPLAYQSLWARNRVIARGAVALLVLLSLVPPGQVIHSFSEERRASVKRLLGMKAPPVPPPSAGASSDAGAPAALMEWARRETPVDALFFTDWFDFRVAALRSITGTFKDGGVVDLAGTRPLYEWYRHMRRVDECRRRVGEGCWFALAREARADFVIVDPRLSRAGPAAGFTRVWERGGWSVWKRLDG